MVLPEQASYAILTKPIGTAKEKGGSGEEDQPRKGTTEKSNKTETR